MGIQSVLTHKTAGVLLMGPLALGAALPALAQNLYIDFVNNTRATMTEIYAVPSGSSSWGPNLLQGQVPPGGVLELDIVDGLSTCMYDLYITFSDGGDWQFEGANLCEMGVVPIND